MAKKSGYKTIIFILFIAVALLFFYNSSFKKEVSGSIVTQNTFSACQSVADNYKSRSFACVGDCIQLDDSKITCTTSTFDDTHGYSLLPNTTKLYKYAFMYSPYDNCNQLDDYPCYYTGQPNCDTSIDLNCDNCVAFNELIQYANKWLNNNIAFSQLMNQANNWLNRDTTKC